MKRAFLIAALLFVPSSASAEVSLGANFGATVSFRDGEKTRVGFGWPYSHTGGFGATPGIRFGFTGGSGHHEGYIDSTVAYQSRFLERFALITGNYQYNFHGHANTFFITGGGGPLIYGTRDYDAVAFIFGGGVGFRQVFANGHGTFREEFRFDFIPGNRDYPQTFLLGVKLGFDLWIR